MLLWREKWSELDLACLLSLWFTHRVKAPWENCAHTKIKQMKADHFFLPPKILYCYFQYHSVWQVFLRFREGYLTNGHSFYSVLKADIKTSEDQVKRKRKKKRILSASFNLILGSSWKARSKGVSLTMFFIILKTILLLVIQQFLLVKTIPQIRVTKQYKF